MKNGVFIDWLTASQHHPQGGLPILSGGVVVHYDASGLPRFERNCAASLPGSYDTSIRVGCDGFRVFLSGNVGRFSRQDNLFNHGWDGTLAAANRILLLCGLPAFSVGIVNSEGKKEGGMVVSRLDLTANFSTGSDAQARAFIRWLGTRSVKRMKQGAAGDWSVWWANTRHMFKAYNKAVEMVKHGAADDEFAVQWCKREGVVRVEIELRKRLLSELGLNRLEDINDDELQAVFEEQTSLLRSVDRSDEPDILASVPARSRAYAAAWLAGQDLSALCSRATLYRHARVLAECGIDVMQPRNLETFPVKVRVVELRPIQVPDWYELEAA